MSDLTNFPIDVEVKGCKSGDTVYFGFDSSNPYYKIKEVKSVEIDDRGSYGTIKLEVEGKSTTKKLLNSYPISSNYNNVTFTYKIGASEDTATVVSDLNNYPCKYGEKPFADGQYLYISAPELKKTLILDTYNAIVVSTTKCLINNDAASVVMDEIDTTYSLRLLYIDNFNSAIDTCEVYKADGTKLSYSMSDNKRLIVSGCKMDDDIFISLYRFDESNFYSEEVVITQTIIDNGGRNVTYDMDKLNADFTVALANGTEWSEGSEETIISPGDYALTVTVTDEPAGIADCVKNAVLSTLSVSDDLGRMSVSGTTLTVAVDPTITKAVIQGKPDNFTFTMTGCNPFAGLISINNIAKIDDDDILTPIS